MENFFISVSNGILKDGHVERIGSSVWVYLWCLDKMTLVEKDGWGLVLGGKPVKLEEISVGGIHRVTVSRHLANLETEGYIRLIHTSRGIAIKVAKAKKWFNNNAKAESNKTVKPPKKRVSRNAKPGLAETLNQHNKTVKPRNKNAKPNKTIQYDNTEDNTVETVPQPISNQKMQPREKAAMFFQGVEDLVNKKEVLWLQELLVGIADKTQAPKGRVWISVLEFCSYWTEKNGTGTRQNWQLRKTFEVEKRLWTWLRRERIAPKEQQRQRGRNII